MLLPPWSRFLVAVALSMLVLVPGVGRAQAHSGGPAPATEENFARLRACESEDDYSASERGVYFGAYQFSAPTWRSLGYEGLPHQAAPEVQDEAAWRLQERDGWQQWPWCSRRLGLA